MIRVVQAEPMHDRWLRLTLTNGSIVERDISDVLWGGVFERIAASDEAFAEVTVANGTAAWLEDGADIAPETLIWNGPEPPDDTDAIPPATMILVSPNRPRS